MIYMPGRRDLWCRKSALNVVRGALNDEEGALNGAGQWRVMICMPERSDEWCGKAALIDAGKERVMM
jgi:hypothetical protein